MRTYSFRNHVLGEADNKESVDSDFQVTDLDEKRRIKDGVGLVIDCF